jgi:hypothetical protein
LDAAAKTASPVSVTTAASAAVVVVDSAAAAALAVEDGGGGGGAKYGEVKDAKTRSALLALEEAIKIFAEGPDTTLTFPASLSRELLLS